MLTQQAKLLPRLIGYHPVCNMILEASGALSAAAAAAASATQNHLAARSYGVARSPDTGMPGPSGGIQPQQEALEQVLHDFQMRPREVSEMLAGKLSTGQRAALAAALAQHTDQHNLSEEYFNELFKAADNDANSELSRSGCATLIK